MRLEFVGQSAKDQDNVQANPSRLVNFYREPVVSGGRSQYVLKGVQGMTQAASVPSVFVRAIDRVAQQVYVVHGGTASHVDLQTGVVTDFGAVDDSVNASISGNNGKVCFVSGGKYYVWNGTSLTEPTPGAFSSFGSVAFVGNYTVLTQKDGRMFQWSAIADATSLPGLSFSTADGRDDNLVRAAAINGQLYLFKEESTEIWFLTGQAGAAAFERQAGGVLDIGLQSHNLLALFDGGAFIIADDGRAYMIGSGFVPISTPPVETAIQKNEPKFCTVHADEGHLFLCIHFDEGASWCYDVATGEWHERGYGADLGPLPVVGAVRQAGAWYVAMTGGSINRLIDTDTDAGVPLVFEAVSRTAEADGDYFAINSLELFPRVGFAEGDVALSISRDGGMTWTAPKVRAFPGVGSYGGRVIWQGLGTCRKATARVRISGMTRPTLLADMVVK